MRWGEEHIEKLPKSMVVDLHRNQIWALGTEVSLEKNGESGALKIDTNKTPSIIECFDDDTKYTQTEKAVRNPADTIKDDTENKSDTGSDSVATSDNMETNETLNYSIMDNAETKEGEDVAIATEFTWFDDLPNDEKSMEIKETVNIDHNNMKFKQRHEVRLITELEIWFNIDDLRIGIDKVEDDIYNDDVLSKIVFRITILPQGKGLQSLFQLEQELQPDCEGQ